MVNIGICIGHCSKREVVTLTRGGAVFGSMMIRHLRTDTFLSLCKVGTLSLFFRHMGFDRRRFN